MIFNGFPWRRHRRDAARGGSAEAKGGKSPHEATKTRSEIVLCLSDLCALCVFAVKGRGVEVKKTASFTAGLAFSGEKHQKKCGVMLDIPKDPVIFVSHCESSSAGRARPCQGRGREFESRLSLKVRF